MVLGSEMAGWLRSRNTLTVMLDKDRAGIPRIHPRRLPQAAGQNVRAIVYHKISDTTEAYLGGPVTVSHAIMQFDCYGRTPDEADDIRERLKNLLTALVRGHMGNAYVTGLVHEGDHDDTEEPEDASDIARFVCSSDFRVSYQRPTT